MQTGYYGLLASRRLALKSALQAFPPGKYFQVPALPNVTAVNALGSFGIAADRLAFIDGEGKVLFYYSYAIFSSFSKLVDPWRPNTPHSEYAPKREDTILRPFKLIPSKSRPKLGARLLTLNTIDAVHHYDEYGLRNMSQEPTEILQIHEEMIVFVREWLEDWKAPS